MRKIALIYSVTTEFINSRTVANFISLATSYPWINIIFIFGGWCWVLALQKFEIFCVIPWKPVINSVCLIFLFDRMQSKAAASVAAAFVTTTSAAVIVIHTHIQKHNQLWIHLNLYNRLTEKRRAKKKKKSNEPSLYSSRDEFGINGCIVCAPRQAMK